MHAPHPPVHRSFWLSFYLPLRHPTSTTRQPSGLSTMGGPSLHGAGRQHHAKVDTVVFCPVDALCLSHSPYLPLLEVFRGSRLPPAPTHSLLRPHAQPLEQCSPCGRVVGTRPAVMASKLFKDSRHGAQSGSGLTGHGDLILKQHRGTRQLASRPHVTPASRRPTAPCAPLSSNGSLLIRTLLPCGHVSS